MFKKIFSYFLMGLNFLFILFTLAGNLHLIVTKSFSIESVTIILNLVSLIFAVIYLFKGFNKEAARWYILFVRMCAVSAFIRIIEKTVLKVDTVTIALSVIAFGMVCLLSITKDLGKKNTRILGIVVLVCTLIDLALAYVGTPGFLRGGTIEGTNKILSTISVSTLALILNFMIYAKYADKEKRKGKGQDE